jgi:hypothetical protein
LLLTVNKLKKLVGEENVGVPVLLDQRIEQAFALDPEAIPSGKEHHPVRPKRRPPLLKPGGECGGHPSLDKEGSRDTNSPPVLGGVAEALRGRGGAQIPNPVIAFSYFNPPIPADVLVRDKKLIFLRTQYFSGHVAKCSGVWKANSKWWDSAWKAQEWDVEIENHGVYRLCKVDKDWFLAGEYD